MCKFHYEEIFEQVRIACQTGLHRYGLFYISYPNTDLYKDMADNMDAHDTSDYPIDHPLHPRTNAKVLGKMKDECSSLAPQEFVGLRAKMYSILLPNGKPKFTAKGVSRRYILKHLHRKDYLRTLKETESTIATFSTLRSQKQQIKTIVLTKNV